MVPLFLECMVSYNFGSIYCRKKWTNFRTILILNKKTTTLLSVFQSFFFCSFLWRWSGRDQRFFFEISIVLKYFHYFFLCNGIIKLNFLSSSTVKKRFKSSMNCFALIFSLTLWEWRKMRWYCFFFYFMIIKRFNSFLFYFQFLNKKNHTILPII